MLEAVKSNYSSTTDLADSIAQTTGVGYRQIYSIVGKLVDELIEAGQPLHSLTAERIVQAASSAGLDIHLTDEQAHVALDPAQAVARRKHIGGSASGEMQRMLSSRRSTLAGQLGWIEERRAAMGKAYQETQASIERLGP